MNRLRAKLGRFTDTLNRQLSLSFALLIILPLLISTALYYGYCASAIQDLTEELVEGQLSESVQELRLELSNINDRANALLMNRELYNVFAAPPAADDYELYRRDQVVRSVLNRTINGLAPVYDSSLITDGYVYGNAAVFQPVSVAARTRLYQIADQGEGQIVWTPSFDYLDMFMQPKESNFAYKRFVAAVKEMNFIASLTNTFNYYQPLPAGVEPPVLAVYVQEEWLQSTMQKLLQREGMQYLICDRAGQVISRSEAQAEDQPAYRPVVPSGGTSYVSHHPVLRDVLNVSMDVGAAGWSVTVYCPLSVILRDARRVLYIGGIACLLLGAVALLVARRIARRIAGPLTRLSSALSESGTGNFSIALSEQGAQETQTLIRSYNRMNEQINTLIAENYERSLREKDMQIMSMQLQMEPHFLYNSLNTINWMAINAGQEDISQVVLYLSNMLQYTLRQTSELSNFDEDLSWTEQYIKMCEIRFGSRIRFDLKMDERLSGTTVPMLFLQPFIENAVKHGLNQTEAGGVVSVRGAIDGDVRLFTITDNGEGMDEATIARVMSRDIKRIGIHNVNERIKLIYGAEYGIQIDAEKGRGTTVTIRIPV